MFIKLKDGNGDKVILNMDDVSFFRKTNYSNGEFTDVFMKSGKVITAQTKIDEIEDFLTKIEAGCL